MMNSPFVLEQSRRLAARPDVVAEADPAKRVAHLYREVLGREPAPREVELAINFVRSEDSAAAVVANSARPWSYGFGEFDESAQRVANFQPLPYWTGAAWQGGPSMPNPKIGWAMLSKDGGHPGDAKHAVVRRWTAPRDCTVAITGQLKHPADQGDGVRARLITSRDGVLATWLVHHKEADTNMAGIAVSKGDTIDFVIDCGSAGDVGYDGFAWKITVTKQPTADKVAGDDNGGGWDSSTEFAGPRPTPLSPWEKYAQVLLESNEFAFVE